MLLHAPVTTLLVVTAILGSGESQPRELPAPRRSVTPRTASNAPAEAGVWTPELRISGAREGVEHKPTKSFVRTLQGRVGATSPEFCRASLATYAAEQLHEPIEELAVTYFQEASWEVLMMVPDQRPGHIWNRGVPDPVNLLRVSGVGNAQLLYGVGLLHRESGSWGRAEDIPNGAEVRVHDTVPGWLAIVDRQIVLMPLDQQDPGKGSVLVRNPMVVRNIHSVFQTMWFTGVPLASAASRILQGRAREVLRLMSGGLTDSAGARVMNISLRTYRRHVADIMRQLGVDSRFQAGAAAHRLGWLR